MSTPRPSAGHDQTTDATALAAAMLRDRVQRMRETQSKPRAVKPVAAAPALTPAPSTTPRPRRTQTSTAPQSTPTATPARKHDPLPVVRPAQAEATVSLQPTEPSPTPLREPKSLPSPDTISGKGELRRALEASKRALKAVGWFSCAINVLMLTGPIFMLQVYDRVMTSGSYSTLDRADADHGGALRRHRRAWS